MASERVQRRIDRLLEQIEEAMDQLNWESVRDCSQAVLALDAENRDATVFLAAAERTLGGATAGTSSVQASPPPLPYVTPAPTPAPAPIATPASPQAPGQPTVEYASFANGRYEVKHLLGEGGKKKVYLAHDTLLDREVAFALIKNEGMDETSKPRITREAQAMGRLGSHPNIVTVFDLGEHEDQTYMVTELMSGGDLEGLITRAPEHQLPIGQAVEISKAVCKALEFAHSHGIVHRDLKPGNVWLTADGVAKIGDFGLAVALDRSRLTLQNMMVGTVAYMPPEQAMGGEVTSKADLYSLGCTMYEMVAGRPPFLGDDMVAFIGQHINTPPASPIWYNSQCPKPLETLLLHLLAKNPAERPESAADVLAVLEGMDVSALPGDGGASPSPARGMEGPSIGVFVGREREMRELKAAVEETFSGRGRLVTLVGEPGIGKTRTAQELAGYAGLRQMQVLWGRCHEAQGAPPYWPWIQSIRSHVRDAELDQLRSDMGGGAVDIAEIVSEVRYRLTDLQLAPSLEPEQARFRLFDSIVTFLRNAAGRQPLMLVLEDLHWADQPSLSLLEFMAKELSGARLLLLGTYREEDLSHLPLAQTLATLAADQPFQKVQLRGFNHEDVGRFIEVITGIKPPQDLVDAVHRRTDGNPLFVTEVAQLLIQEGELTPERSQERQSWSVRIPQGMMQVVGRRLDQLSPRCSRTLSVASLIGREFSLEHVRLLIGDVSKDQLLDVVQEALAARVIEVLPQATDCYQFSHAVVQETLSGTLSPPMQVQLHARIGNMLEELYGDDAQAHSPELAYHFAEAEPVLGSEKLVLYSRIAGERAAATYAHEDALTHFRRALAAKQGQDMDDETAGLLIGLGHAQAATLQSHQLGEAVGNLRRAFEYYAESGDGARAVSAVEHSLPWLSVSLAGVTPLITRALALATPDSSQAGRLQSFYGRVMGMEIGDYDAAQEALGTALDIARLEEDETLGMWTLLAAANVDLYHLRLQQSLGQSLTAIDLAQEENDPVAEVDGRFYAATALGIIGNLERAQAQTEAGLAIAEKLRDRFWLSSTLWASEVVSRLRGDWKAAREFSDRGLAASSTDPRLLATRTLMECETGNGKEAAAYLERLLSAISETPSGQTLEYVLPALAISLASRLTGAEEHLSVAESTAEDVLSLPSPTPLIARLSRAALGLASAQRGDAAGAMRYYSGLASDSGGMLLGGMISVERVRALLLQTTGRLADAMSQFEAALVSCRTAFRPEYAWVCSDYSNALLQRGATGDRAKATSLLDEALSISQELGMQRLTERILDRKVADQGLDSSDFRGSIGAIVSSVEGDIPELSQHASPDGIVTLLFSDIEGSTDMTERMGDQRAQEVFHVHNAIIRKHIKEQGGFEVKSMGDGFMVAFSSGRRALQSSVAIQRTLADYNEHHPQELIRVRMGLHTGEAIKESEDFFGRNVILAARIAAKAKGGQVLVSSLLKELTERSGEFSFDAGIEMELKGLSGTHRVFEVRWQGP